MQAVHEHRVVGHPCRQQRLVRIPVCPGAFVPAAADDPLALRHGLRALDDQFDRLFLRVDADEIYLVEQSAQAEDVRVRIDQSRNDRRAGQIDNPGLVSGELHRLDAAADEQDIAVPDRNGLGIRVPATSITRGTRCSGTVGTRLLPIERVHPAVDEYQAGIPQHDGFDGFRRFFGTTACQAQQQEGL